MILTGIGDEGANTIDGQIKATLDLGWKYLEPRGVEVPGFAKANFHDIPDQAFDLAVHKLDSAGVGVYCFGSTIMNWSKKIGDPFEITLAEVKRAIPRMKRLGTKFIRVMSFKPGDDENGFEIVMTNRTQVITGSVTNEKNEAVKEYTVVVFPEDQSKWTVSATRWRSAARPDQQGQFKIADLPPGRYLAIALEYIPEGEWMDPEWQTRTAKKAVAFTLDEGATKTLDLKLAGS